MLLVSIELLFNLDQRSKISPILDTKTCFAFCFVSDTLFYKQYQDMRKLQFYGDLEI